MSTIAEPSVQSHFLIAHSGNNILSTATGFTVKNAAGKPFLITNWHVASGRNPTSGQPLSDTGAIPDKLSVLHNVNPAPGQADGITWQARTEQLLNAAHSPKWLEHPTLGRRVDVVALPLQSLHDVILRPYNLEPGMDIRLGPSDRVSIVGYPFGRTAGAAFPVWSAGAIASEPDVDFEELPSFLIDSRTRQGQSGSPVIFSSNGAPLQMRDGSTAMIAGSLIQLLGVYSGRISEESDLGIVWKKHVVLEIIEQGVPGNNEFIAPSVRRFFEEQGLFNARPAQ